MVDRLAGAFQEFFDDDTWCRNVRITDSKVDQIDPARQSRAFSPVYLGE
jgi:hypothetical protein